MANFNLIKLFLIRDLNIFISYRFAALGAFILIFLNIFVFFFFSEYIDSLANFDDKKNSYFYYVLYGLAISDVSLMIVNKLCNEIRNYQLIGVMEYVATSKIGAVNAFMCSYAFPTFLSLLRIIFYFLIGEAISGYPFFSSLSLSFFILFFIFIISTSGIGMMAAAFIVFFKKGNPIGQIYLLLSSGIGGVFFPTNVYPEIIEKLSYLLPIKHFLDILRIRNESISYEEVLPSLMMLLLLAIIYFLLGTLTIKYSVKMAKMHGNLNVY